MKQFRAIILASLLALILGASPAFAFVQADISGQVNSSGAWANYTTQRTLTDASWNYPHVKILSWPASHLYMYIRRCNNNEPIGSWTPNAPLPIAGGDSNWKNLGPISAGQCFRISAKRDGWFYNEWLWWTGQLRW